ncbi:MAG TPA: hypothetical protein DDY89_06795 [Lysinibacillus sp.]|nr:hypothetical protein [Lysinibacillus sp.]
MYSKGNKVNRIKEISQAVPMMYPTPFTFFCGFCIRVGWSSPLKLSAIVILIVVLRMLSVNNKLKLPWKFLH